MSPALEVLATGPLVLVQDHGRPGLAAVGVGRSGAADRTAYRLGARLVGHPDDRAALEVLLGGLTVRAHGRVTVTPTGAHAPTTLEGRHVGHATLVDLPDGAVLSVGMPSVGVRTYLTVRGGIDVAPVLGSRSTDTLSGVGPPPVRVGDLLPVGDPGTAFPHVDHVAHPPHHVVRAGTGAGTDALEVLPGPRAEWVGGWAADLGGLLSGEWHVSGHSDRIGLRLSGSRVARIRGWREAELPSEGIVRGAVQVTPGGEPVVFLADHPVTGGYPVVAVLTASACDRAAQLRPGDSVRLVRARAR